MHLHCQALTCNHHSVLLNPQRCSRLLLSPPRCRFESHISVRRAVAGQHADANPASAGIAPPDTSSSRLRGRDEWALRRKQRVADEIVEAARKAGLPASPDQLHSGLQQLEALLPGFLPNLDSMRPVEWARLASNPAEVASKLVCLKSHYPRLDLGPLLAANPKLLMQPVERLDKSANQVKELLARAKDMEALLAAVPALLDPRQLISVLTTITKWYHLEKDPIEVLEADPDLVQRAQDDDIPFEPVYMDEAGNWTAPLLNYAEKRTQWQAYIDQTFYKQS